MILGEGFIMWFIVFFDLPTRTKRQRFAYTLFRSQLLKQGFDMLQYSVYIRSIMGRKAGEKYEKIVTSFIPEGGKVRTMIISDFQFGCSKSYFGKEIGLAEELEIEKAKEDVITLF